MADSVTDYEASMFSRVEFEHELADEPG
jgi:hypothetical protein